jgi:integrase
VSNWPKNDHYTNSNQAGRAKDVGKARLKLVKPAILKRTVTPTRLPNADLRTREYLTEAEVERLMKAATRKRWGHRDATMILVAYRHGFRPAELVDLRWDQIEFASGALYVRRVKRGTTSERGAPFSTAGFARMIERAGVEARLGFKPAATRSRTRGTTRALCKPISATATSSTRSDTLSFRRPDLGTSGACKRWYRPQQRRLPPRSYV